MTTTSFLPGAISEHGGVMLDGLYVALILIFFLATYTLAHGFERV